MMFVLKYDGFYAKNEALKVIAYRTRREARIAAEGLDAKVVEIEQLPKHERNVLQKFDAIGRADVGLEAQEAA